LTYVDVLISGGREKMSRTFRLLVNGGSMFTWVNGVALKELGVEPRAKKKFRTIEGRKILRDVSEAKHELNGEKATRIVVFAEGRDIAVLGVDSLEGLGFEIDPLTNKLKKLETFAAY
jgi:predicted aspartyl protease